MEIRYRLLLKVVCGFLLLLVAIGLLSSAQGSRLVEFEDFDGIDGNPPNPLKWTIYNRDSNDFMKLDGDTLWGKQVNGGWSTAGLKKEYEEDEITVIVDWKPIATSGRPIDLRIVVNSSGTDKHWITMMYEGGKGWGHSRRIAGSLSASFSNNDNARIGDWYTFNLTIKGNKLDFTVTKKSDGSLQYSQTDISVDIPNGALKVKIGVFGYNTYNPNSNFDNFKLYDNTLPPNKVPVWTSVPKLTAVEDVPFTYDFSTHVSDPDGPFEELSLASHSPMVTGIDGMEVTFLFPNGVLGAFIPVILSDGWDQMVTDVNFTVTPVNDPPFHIVPEDHTAEEDIPYQFNLRAFVWDIDNKKDDLSLEVDDPYITVDGLNITVTFPQGIETHEAQLNLTDGDLYTPIILRFTIMPVDDPPTIAPLGTIEVIEDHEKVFNITPFVDDEDTPIEDLTLLIRNRNCSVEGLEIHIHFTLGGFDEVITIQVTDGHSMVQEQLTVHVVEWNDPPMAHTPSPKSVTEGEATIVDLGPYIEDEDTPREELVLQCDHPAVVDITGFNITLFFDVWAPQHDIAFTVFDGAISANASFMVQVQAVNDDPVIEGISDMMAPYVIEMDEGTTVWLKVKVEDEDSETFLYTVDSHWLGIVAFTNGSIRLISEWNVIEEYTATVTVKDADDGIDSVDLSIIIKNVNDPPAFPVFIKPQNHTVVEQGANVSFAIEISDPDIAFGQVLTASWSSNVTGPFMVRTNKEALEFTHDALPIGTHKITVSLTDGEYTRDAWMKIVVIEPYVEPPPDDPKDPGNSGDSPITGTVSMIALLVIVVLVIVVVVLVLTRSRDVKEPEVVDRPAKREEPTEIIIEERSPDGLATLAVQLDEIATTLEEERDRERAQERTEARVELETLVIQNVGEQGGDLSQEEIDERQHAKEVREVMKALTQLPRGLPTSLWNWDMGELANTLVDGESRMAPNGTRIVRIDATWYYADHTKRGSFLTEWKEPKALEPEARAMADEDYRTQKLEQLEERLLDGAISEETYNRLRKKYGG